MARGLHDIGRYWEGRDRADEAAKCYRLAIETDAPSETLSRALRAALRRVRGADEAAAQ
jgi:hypothetical protein